MDAVLAATGGRLEGNPSRPLTGVSIDSRTIAPGDIFIAIKGCNLDGHRFVADAFAKGAALAIVSSAGEDIENKGALAVVGDTLSALEALGRAARAAIKGKIIAVTGSVGKTGTKEALKLALERSGSTHVSAASYNNQWGVPLSLARMPADSAFGVFEAGMNHPGEIAPLSKLIAPHVALITNVEPVHIGFFDSLDRIAEAKAEIFSGLEPGGAAILNRDNDYFDLLAARAVKAGADEVIGFGARPTAQARLIDAVLQETGSCVKAEILGQAVTYKIGAPGRHLVLNSLGALAAVSVLGGDLALGALGLEALRPQDGRGARHVFDLPGGLVTVIDESYNANPASMRAALAVLGAIGLKGRGRRIAILGDMLELGHEAPAFHAALAGPVTEAKVDVAHVCGPNMLQLWQDLPDGMKGVYAETSADLKEVVCAGLEPGDVIMVKGSLGSNMRPLVDAVIDTLRRAGKQTSA